MAKPKYKKLNEAQKKQVKALLAQGLKVIQISRALKISYNSVHYLANPNVRASMKRSNERAKAAAIAPAPVVPQVTERLEPVAPAPMVAGSPLMNKSGVAAYLGMKVAKVTSLTYKGHLASVRVGRLHYYRRNDVDAWINGLKPSAKAPAK